MGAPPALLRQQNTSAAGAIMHFSREEDPTLQACARERRPKEDSVLDLKSQEMVARNAPALSGDLATESAGTTVWGGACAANLPIASLPLSVESMASMVEISISGAEPSITDAALHHLEMCLHSVDLGCLPMTGHEHILPSWCCMSRRHLRLSNGGSINRETISKFVCLTLPEHTLILLRPELPSFTEDSASTEPRPHHVYHAMHKK